MRTCQKPRFSFQSYFFCKIQQQQQQYSSSFSLSLSSSLRHYHHHSTTKATTFPSSSNSSSWKSDLLLSNKQQKVNLTQNTQQQHQQRQPLFSLSKESNNNQQQQQNFLNNNNTKQPRFLEKLKEQEESRHVCFKFPSIMSVEDFCDQVNKFCREATSTMKKLSPELIERNRERKIVNNNKNNNNNSNNNRDFDLVQVDYQHVAERLSQIIRPSYVKQFLLEQKVFNPQFEREPLMPYECARQLILNCISSSSGDETTRKYFEEKDLKYIELDRFAHPELVKNNNTNSSTTQSNSSFSTFSTNKNTKIKIPPYRVPIVLIAGNIDHGKTTLLDTLQNSNLVDTEPGLITQSIRAFTINVDISSSSSSSSTKNNNMIVVDENEEEKNTTKNMICWKDIKDMTFIDTPGHRIFAEMRLTGSRISDIVLLLVSLEEGVKGQTEEIIKTALQYEKPVIVALSKVDLYTDPGLLAKRISLVKKQLSSLGISLKVADNEHQVKFLLEKSRNSCYRLDRATNRHFVVDDQNDQNDNNVDGETQINLDHGNKKQNNDNNNNNNNNSSGNTNQQKSFFGASSSSSNNICIGICISAKFGINVPLLIRTLQRISGHSSLPRISETSEPTQAVVLESFRDFSASSITENNNNNSSENNNNKKNSSFGAKSGWHDSNLSSENNKRQNKNKHHSKPGSGTGEVNIVAILRNGSLKIGMPFVADQSYGKIERVTNTWGDVLPTDSSTSTNSSSSLQNFEQTNNTSNNNNSQIKQEEGATIKAKPGTAVVIYGTKGTTSCPGSGVHVLSLRSLDEAQNTSRFRNRLRFFIERHPKQVHLLRPKGMPTHFLHVGNYGQVSPDSAFDYKILYKEAKLPEVRESPSELQWRSVQLPPEQQPKTEKEYEELCKRSKLIWFLIKVDSWSSARVVQREIPRLSTKNVIVNIISVGFGPIIDSELQKYPQLDFVVNFRGPRLSCAQTDFVMRGRNIRYGEFDVYTDMMEWLKKNILVIQGEESKKRDPQDVADKQRQRSLLRVAGYDLKKTEEELEREQEEEEEQQQQRQHQQQGGENTTSTDNSSSSSSSSLQQQQRKNQRRTRQQLTPKKKEVMFRAQLE